MVTRPREGVPGRGANHHDMAMSLLPNEEEGPPVQMVWSRKTRMSKALVSSLEPGQHKDKLRQTRTSILRPCCTGVRRLVPCWRSRAWLSIVENQPRPQPFRKCSCRMSSFKFLGFMMDWAKETEKKSWSGESVSPEQEQPWAMQVWSFLLAPPLISQCRITEAW